MQKTAFWVLLVGHKEVTPITALETSLGPSLTETEARAIFAQGNEVEWATPVLYMRSPNGQLFRLARKARTFSLPVSRQGIGML